MDSDTSPKSRPLSDDILRNYDIRGIFDVNLFTDDAYKIGRAFGTYLHRKGLKKIAVGHDCRNSSEALVSSLINGLIRSGAEVVELGVCHTPLVYYTVHKFSMDAGIMVTGSHNTGEYNGFKFMVGTDSFYGSEIKKLGKSAQLKDFDEVSGREIIMNDIFSQYISDILSGFVFSDDLKIAWDIGNGATSNVIREIVTRIPGQHHILFEDMNGDFPNRQPDPTVESNVSYLKKLVAYNKFDAGFAFDSDGDRLSVVNFQGQMIRSDQLLEVFATDFLRKNPGAQVIGDVKVCNRVFDTIKNLGGIPIMEKVGHSFIKARMKSSGALLAGEMSGHFYFNDSWYGFDDGIYAALRCLEILGNDKNAFTNIPYGYVTPEIRIGCKEDEKSAIVSGIKSDLRNNKVDFCEIDGIRVTNNLGWWLLRPSNTQNAISLRIEANQKEDISAIFDEISGYLRTYVNQIRTILSRYE